MTDRPEKTDKLERVDLRRYRDILLKIHSRHVSLSIPKFASLLIHDDQIATITLEADRIILAIDNLGVAIIYSDGRTQGQFDGLTQFLVCADEADEQVLDALKNFSSDLCSTIKNK